MMKMALSFFFFYLRGKKPSRAKALKRRPAVWFMGRRLIMEERNEDFYQKKKILVTIFVGNFFLKIWSCKKNYFGKI